MLQPRQKPDSPRKQGSYAPRVVSYSRIFAYLISNFLFTTIIALILENSNTNTL